jgi:NAD(P)H-hydrate epimerase
MELICPQMMEFAKAPRAYDTHKSHYGRVWLWVGSEPYSGAAALSATGALHGGAGLVTVFTPAAAHAAVRALCPPEVMVRNLDWNALPAPDGCDVLVIGCGLGEISSEHTEMWLRWVESFPGMAVIDADALNSLARHGGLHRLGPRQVLTPHPGEFARLFPEGHSMSRETAAREFCEKFAPILVLKGARTLVSGKGQPLWCNGTGGPSMACGGQGDLLAGVLGAQLARGLPTTEAAALAVWICGRAAERALCFDTASEESLTPSQCAKHLGGAFLDWKKSLR